jgi:dihydropteroate synthase
VKAGPGEPVDSQEEIRRTASFVAAVRQRHPSLVISVDTWRAEVARELCHRGADLVNDTWAGAEPELVQVSAEFGVGLVCSHTGGLAPRGPFSSGIGQCAARNAHEGWNPRRPA